MSSLVPPAAIIPLFFPNDTLLHIAYSWLVAAGRGKSPAGVLVGGKRKAPKEGGVATSAPHPPSLSNGIAFHSLVHKRSPPMNSPHAHLHSTTPARAVVPNYTYVFPLHTSTFFRPVAHGRGKLPAHARSPAFR